MIEPQTGCEEFEVAFVNCGRGVNRFYGFHGAEDMR